MSEMGALPSGRLLRIVAYFLDRHAPRCQHHPRAIQRARRMYSAVVDLARNAGGNSVRQPIVDTRVILSIVEGVAQVGVGDACSRLHQLRRRRRLLYASVVIADRIHHCLRSSTEPDSAYADD
ncbi:hypothetical protein QP162_07530 [Sphingomonas aurantiaca]|uniref:hypothetical protein n=1 Tax=Sphingomonas aurantiaca TaxID=185949 RepID=UPI002FDFF1B1